MKNIDMLKMFFSKYVTTLSPLSLSLSLPPSLYLSVSPSISISISLTHTHYILYPSIHPIYVVNHHLKKGWLLLMNKKILTPE